MSPTSVRTVAACLEYILRMRKHSLIQSADNFYYTGWGGRVVSITGETSGWRVFENKWIERRAKQLSSEEVIALIDKAEHQIEINRSADVKAS